jgi:hypothetical protein
MAEEIPYGCCHCGCGRKTKLQSRNNARLGIKKGDPNKYCPGHNPPQHGPEHSQWKGGTRAAGSNGKYMSIWMPQHPRANKKGYVLEHILMAEKALGKPLPENAVVHHTDNQYGQIDKYGLVICPDAAYHMMIHQRMIAYEKCGHASWRQCPYCHQYDDTKNMQKKRVNYEHQQCATNYQHEYHLRRGKSLREKRKLIELLLHWR